MDWITRTDSMLFGTDDDKEQTELMELQIKLCGVENHIAMLSYEVKECETQKEKEDVFVHIAKLTKQKDDLQADKLRLLTFLQNRSSHNNKE